MLNDFSDTTVVIPTYNESNTIGKLVDALLSQYPKISIVVSDDGSVDGTAEMVRSRHHRNVMFIDRHSLGRKRGLTGSVIDGIFASKKKYVVVMDGDFQHPPEAVRSIVSRLRKVDTHIVVAVRKKVGRWSLHRKIISKSLMLACDLSLILRRSARCSDIFSGYFGCDRRWIINLMSRNRSRYVSEGYKVLYDTLKCMHNDEKIGEVGYRFGIRKGGASKAGAAHVLALAKSVFS